MGHHLILFKRQREATHDPLSLARQSLNAILLHILITLIHYLLATLIPPALLKQTTPVFLAKPIAVRCNILKDVSCQSIHSNHCFALMQIDLPKCRNLIRIKVPFLMMGLMCSFILNVLLGQHIMGRDILGAAEKNYY